MGNNGYMDAQQLPDLLRLRGSVVAASDEFFAEKENLIKPTAPVFDPTRSAPRGRSTTAGRPGGAAGPAARCPTPPSTTG